LIKLLQVVCPKGHSQVALAYDDCVVIERSAKVEIENILDKCRLVQCGLCHAGRSDFSFKTSDTKYQTIEEAQKNLREIQIRTLNRANMLKAYFTSVRN
jgi:hypothetical protein